MQLTEAVLNVNCPPGFLRRAVDKSVERDDSAIEIDAGGYPNHLRRPPSGEGVFLFSSHPMDNAAMRGLEHPLSGARYELEPDGTVTVHHQGRTGIFDGRGRWLSGQLRWADPHLCGWLTAEPSR